MVSEQERDGRPTLSRAFPEPLHRDRSRCLGIRPASRVPDAVGQGGLVTVPEAAPTPPGPLRTSSIACIRLRRGKGSAECRREDAG